MAEKKYISLSKLSTFLDKLKLIFATKIYTDNAVAQKTQVQIVTWGADD